MGKPIQEKSNSPKAFDSTGLEWYIVYMIIYKITNRTNNKCYIGQTIKSLDVRIREHINSPKTKQVLHKAIHTYGINNFFWETICECDTKEELDDMEFHYIKQYKSHGTENGYNMTWGGEGTIGYKHTNQTKQIISDKNKGNKHTEEWKDDHSDILKGRKYSEDHKLNISKSLTGRILSEEHLDNIRLSKVGKTHSDNTKEKMSKSHKGHNRNKKGVDNNLSKQFVITHPNGHQETIKGLNEYCRQYSLNSSSMVQVAKGKAKQHKGFICCYAKGDL